jgi:hypothetical protein
MMDANGLIIVIMAVFLIGATSLVLVMSGRRRRTGEIKKQLGSENRQAVQQYGDPQKAQAELHARQEWVGAFHIHPLAHGKGNHFARLLKRAQGKLANAPDKTVADADHVVQQVMQQRGYPVGDFKLRADDIPVDRSNVMTHFERTSYIIELLSINPDMNNGRRAIAKPSSRIELQ